MCRVAARGGMGKGEGRRGMRRERGLARLDGVAVEAAVRVVRSDVRDGRDGAPRRLLAVLVAACAAARESEEAR